MEALPSSCSLLHSQANYKRLSPAPSSSSSFFFSSLLSHHVQAQLVVAMEALPSSSSPCCLLGSQASYKRQSLLSSFSSSSSSFFSRFSSLSTPIVRLLAAAPFLWEQHAANAAISYDELVGGGAGGGATGGGADMSSISIPEIPAVDIGVDVAGVANSVAEFISANPLVLPGGLAIVGLPILLSRLLSGGLSKNWGFASAKSVFEKLANDSTAQLIDIRPSTDIRTEGTPDLKAFKKRVLQLPYNGDAEAFLKKALPKFQQPDSTTVYVLDRFDGDSLAVAELLAKSGFQSAFAVKDGAEGPSGWQSSDLPWLMPRKSLFDLNILKDVFDSSLNTEGSSVLPATLGVAAAAGVSAVVFSEAETVLQLLGSAALFQLFVKKLLFAKDREKTIKELQSFLETKVAPEELVSEIKGIGKVFLPKNEGTPAMVTDNGSVMTVTSVPQPSPDMVAAEPSKVEATTPPPAEVTPSKVEATTYNADTKPPLVEVPSSTRPLSPFAQYPGLKPPTSPIPSRPSPA